MYVTTYYIALCMKSTTIQGMTKIDPADLIDAHEVAGIIGLSRGGNVSLYRQRHDNFPTPVVEKGRCVLWRRQDVEKWAKATGRLK